MNARQRQNKLSSITIDDAVNHHAWLRECFTLELKMRLTCSQYEYYENIYHCALLLHQIADLSDLELLFSAKCSGDMDLGSGFDWQFLFLTEPDSLKQYALSINRSDIAAWVDNYKTSYQEEDMDGWLSHTNSYYGVKTAIQK
ncbi:hypothetical protein [Thalassomonas sp. RHCl1]|uniref:hypothetical protein n=1 Tax=Thalassomonas sp. RHCl1 TaxID=2995320 RepID=UPI00248CDE3A|nr:hypothetical protein [Thalassomonas sp. RHCl1]